MKARQVEKWVWILIYSGLLLLCLSLFVLRRGSALAYVLMALGALLVPAGVFLIVLRSRMPPDEE